MKKQFPLLGRIFPLLLPIGGLHAQEIPTYPTLPCEGACPQFTPAKPTSRPRLDFTSEQVGAGEEAAISVSFTIGADGRTKNAIVEQIVGSASFAENAKQQALEATFDPAIEDGRPVEENKLSRYIFRMSPSPQHPAVIQAYHDALSQKTPADKIAALKAIQSRAALSLYETAMIAAEMAQLEAETGDDRAALRDIEVATLENGAFLDKNEVEHALRLQIVLEAHAGEYGTALATFDTLNKLKGAVTENDPEAQLIARLRAKIASSEPLWASGEIPNGPGIAHWHHTMLRRSFGFADIKGTLNNFDLRCQTHGIESPVSESATWTIPPSWTKCMIFVEGTPGTTFQFGEAQPDTAAAQDKPN